MIDTNEVGQRIYCFLGLPGSGKGTQIELLSKSLGAKIISIGEEIRDEIDGADLSDPFYSEMKSRYDEGTPQPDHVVIDIVKKRLKDTKNNIIFDNFPFSHNQVNLFFQICEDLNVRKPELIIIHISAEESVKRIVYRKVCSDCGHVMISDGDVVCEKCAGPMVSRADDNVDTVKERIKNYLPRIEEVEKYFRSKGRVIEIDGEGSIPEVSQLVFEAL